jgi:pseudouridine kinase
MPPDHIENDNIRTRQQPSSVRVACIGGATIDRTCRLAAPVQLGTSMPVKGRRGFGGVARNVAENLARLAVPTSLVSTVGDDETGRSICRHLEDLGVDMGGMRLSAARPTAEYTAVVGPEGDLVLGLADMAILDAFTEEDLDRAWPHLESADWIFADCNLPACVLHPLIARCHRSGRRLAVDAVSAPKAMRLPRDLSGIDLLFLNDDEASAWLGHVADRTSGPADSAAAVLEHGARSVVVTLGRRGLFIASGNSTSALPAVPAEPVDVTGAGDALIAGILSRLVMGEPLEAAARVGLLFAALTVEVEGSARSDLSPALLESERRRLIIRHAE